MSHSEAKAASREPNQSRKCEVRAWALQRGKRCVAQHTYPSLFLGRGSSSGWPVISSEGKKKKKIPTRSS